MPMTIKTTISYIAKTVSKNDWSNTSPPLYCDCERSHNGLGIGGRVCDCVCPQCGVATTTSEEWREGVCMECWNQNQDALDLHYTEYDRWSRMTDKERGAAINAALRGLV